MTHVNKVTACYSHAVGAAQRAQDRKICFPSKRFRRLGEIYKKMFMSINVVNVLTCTMKTSSLTGHFIHLDCRHNNRNAKGFAPLRTRTDTHTLKTIWKMLFIYFLLRFIYVNFF